jgi:hypothetical protein
MKITEAILRLSQLKMLHGDIDVLADCPCCKTTFPCDLCVPAPVTVHLRETPKDENGAEVLP